VVFFTKILKNSFYIERRYAPAMCGVYMEFYFVAGIFLSGTWYQFDTLAKSVVGRMHHHQTATIFHISLKLFLIFSRPHRAVVIAQQQIVF
jgi:hypothetical protein